MSHSQGDFVTIVNIPEGNHEYKYIVDGNEQINSNAKISESSKNNVISVKKSDFEVFEALAMDLASNTKSNDYSNTNNGSPKGEHELFGLQSPSDVVSTIEFIADYKTSSLKTSTNTSKKSSKTNF